MFTSEAISVSVIALAVGVLGAALAVVKSISTLLTAYIDAKTSALQSQIADNKAKIDKQGDSIDRLNDGGGLAIVDSRLRDHALIPALTVLRLPGSLTRVSDTVTSSVLQAEAALPAHVATAGGPEQSQVYQS